MMSFALGNQDADRNSPLINWRRIYI